MKKMVFVSFFILYILWTSLGDDGIYIYRRLSSPDSLSLVALQEGKLSRLHESKSVATDMYGLRMASNYKDSVCVAYFKEDRLFVKMFRNNTWFDLGIATAGKHIEHMQLAVESGGAALIAYESNEKANGKDFAIIIKRYHGRTWVEYGRLSVPGFDVVLNATMLINPSDSPVFFLNVYSRVSKKKLFLIKEYRNGQWKVVFQKNCASSRQNEHPCHFTAADNTYYYSTSSSDLKSNVYYTHIYMVKKGKEKKLATRKANIHRINVRNNYVYLFYKKGGGSLAAEKYNGTGWKKLKDVPVNSVVTWDSSIAADGTVFLACTQFLSEANKTGLHMLSYSNQNWKHEAEMKTPRRFVSSLAVSCYQDTIPICAVTHSGAIN